MLYCTFPDNQTYCHNALFDLIMDLIQVEVDYIQISKVKITFDIESVSLLA